MDAANLVAEIKVERVDVQADPKFVNTYAAQATILSLTRVAASLTAPPQPGDLITITGLGGERDNSGVLYAGMPRPLINQKYTAYLSRATDGTYQIQGFELGLRPEAVLRNYSRNRTDGSNGDGTGPFLFWDDSYFPLPYYISADSFEGLRPFLSAVDAAFGTWRAVDNIKVEFLAMGCSNDTVDRNDGINNVIFVTQNWPFDPTAIAITRNFYLAGDSPRSGMILDTDIMINAQDHQFTTTGESGKYDLQDILTHEVGHFLGMGHEVPPLDTQATMYALAFPGELNKRTLHPDDLAGIRSAYGGVGIKLGPPHSDCAVPSGLPLGCMAVHRDGARPLGPLAAIFYLLLLVGLARRTGAYTRAKTPQLPFK